MATAYLALGSNVGDSQTKLIEAIRLLGLSITDIKQAPVYLARAVGYTDQPDFLNTVVSGQTELGPEALLDFVKSVELQVGRTPSFRWGPREIDIDIILYGDLVQQTDSLTIPHPEFRQRDFVLQPLCDLDPGLVDPGSGQNVQSLLATLTPEQKSLVKRVDVAA